ncbi:hypothetical protein HMPREF3213_02451 [Heyndrickxia coagulans]|uniref:Uncharacterized protein n=1 Tax=Heyndrickxia coagulans TaxID=1398 RepID=A0A0C5CK52_HEYCO|nr:hypothetical protein SB48_HM08orf01490 [Heyndrickxia coagulans]KWZ79861.1 hypothetical protein HMPREF3213_02451 [Heyndrickxia coagulans]
MEEIPFKNAGPPFFCQEMKQNFFYKYNNKNMLKYCFKVHIIVSKEGCMIAWIFNILE